MKIALNSKTLCNIKDFNPFNELRDFKDLSPTQIQQVLIILSYTKYLQSKGLLKDLEVSFE